MKYAMTMRLKTQYMAVQAVNCTKKLKDVSDTTPPTLLTVTGCLLKTHHRALSIDA